MVGLCFISGCFVNLLMEYLAGVTEAVSNGGGRKILLMQGLCVTMRSRKIQFRRGMTLVEALMASTLLAMGASAVLLPFNIGAQSETEDARRTLAMHLARELMEEIISKPFDDPEGGGGRGPDSGESSRLYFDNIDDYDGYRDGYGETISEIVGMKNQVIQGVAIDGLHRDVSVEYMHVSGQDLGDDPNFVRVEISMGYMGDNLLTLRRLVHVPQ